MGKKDKKKDSGKASKKQQKRAIKEAKGLIKDIFDKIHQGSPLGGVGLLIIPVNVDEIVDRDKPLESTISLQDQDRVMNMIENDRLQSNIKSNIPNSNQITDSMNSR